jgi:predicted metalloprotease
MLFSSMFALVNGILKGFSRRKPRPTRFAAKARDRDRSLTERRRTASVQELKSLAARHWNEWLPQKVKELKAEARLTEELQAAANLAQDEIEHLMKRGYSEQEGPRS